MFGTSLLACESCLQLLRLEGSLESLQVSSAMIYHVFVNPTVCMLHGFSSVLPRGGPEMSLPILPMEPPTAAHPRKCRCGWCVHFFEKEMFLIFVYSVRISSSPSHSISILPPRTNISPENQWLEDEISFWNGPFFRWHANFPAGGSLWYFGRSYVWFHTPNPKE